MIRARAAAALTAAALVAGCTGAAFEPIAGIPTRNAPECIVTDVVDGDTVKMTCLGSAGTARLVGFDTPETFRPQCRAEEHLGKRATAYLYHRLRATEVMGMKFHGTDKYDRALVSLTLDGTPLDRIMVDAGLAVPYDGGKRINWCERLARA